MRKLFGRFDGSGIGSGIRIANGITFFVPPGLCEHASQLDLARVGRLAVGLAFTSLRFFLPYRNSGPIHWHIQNRNRLTHHNGQVQLDGFANFPLLAGGDIGSDGLRRALHRFDGHLQFGQKLHLLPTAIKRPLLAH